MQYPYIIIAISALVIVVLFLLLFKGKTKAQITPLAGLAFAFIISGIIFGENRLLGYGLIGGGVVLAIIDIVIKQRK